MRTVAPFPGGDKPRTFAAMLTQLTAIAHAKLPQEQHGRLEMGHAIVVAGGVFPEDDGTHFSVCSQEGEAAHTYLVNSACPCKDAQFGAPQARCKHWFAALLYKRTLEELAAPGAPVAPAALPEAPTSVNVRLTIDGHEVQLTLRGVAEDEVLARLERVLARYPAAPTPRSTASEPEQRLCARHGVPLEQRRSKKNGKPYWCHTAAGGGVCFGD